MAIFLIGNRSYTKKSAALDAIREIRDRVGRGHKVTPADDEFLRDLVALHPEAVNKVGVGIARFEVRENFGGTKGFWIIRRDGTSTDFSYIKCLYGATHEAEARSAMRYAVIDQMDAARDRAFAGASSLECPITGETITRETSHIDHADPTFLEIADAFAERLGGYEAIATVANDGDIGRRFADNELREEWRDFHSEKATLRAVSKSANLSILRRGAGGRTQPK